MCGIPSLSQIFVRESQCTRKLSNKHGVCVSLNRLNENISKSILNFFDFSKFSPRSCLLIEEFVPVVYNVKSAFYAHNHRHICNSSHLNHESCLCEVSFVSLGFLCDCFPSFLGVATHSRCMIFVSMKVTLKFDNNKKKIMASQ